MTPIQNLPTSHPFHRPHLVWSHPSPGPAQELLPQDSQLRPLLSTLFSSQQPKDVCEPLSQVTSVLCLDPYRHGSHFL